MKKLVRLPAALLALCLMAAAWGAQALAAETNLPAGFLIGDENGISVTDAGEYFLCSDHLLPGDVITRTLTLLNLEQGEPYRLYMLGDAPASSGNVDWLDNLHLRITLEGQLLYSGRLRGDGREACGMPGNGADLIRQGLNLGTYGKGDRKTLRFVVTANAGLSAQDLREVSSARINWVFHAVKDAPPDPPQTGDALRGGIYILLLSICVLCAVFYRRYRKLRGNKT
ncbi:MAG: hypothetical protein FWC27_06555 [Firmicutes bacterium]|nr:hypothetical protein [Bacillota bacterium]